jgi:hypothetical protein
MKGCKSLTVSGSRLCLSELGLLILDSYQDSGNGSFIIGVN